MTRRDLMNALKGHRLMISEGNEESIRDSQILLAALIKEKGIPRGILINTIDEFLKQADIYDKGTAGN